MFLEPCHAAPRRADLVTLALAGRRTAHSAREQQRTAVHLFVLLTHGATFVNDRARRKITVHSSGLEGWTSMFVKRDVSTSVFALLGLLGHVALRDGLVAQGGFAPVFEDDGDEDDQ